MSEQPVIFLAFSNSQDAYLSMLKRESRSINQALEDLEDKGQIRLAREESATIEEIFHNFNRFRDRIAIFHYGGHADGGSLEFEGTSGHAEGLANEFATLKNLQLVFLNGCSTKGQVDYLLEIGVKAVIATAVPISDNKATEFAEHFYRALANKSTIRNAFNFGVNFLTTKYGRTIQPRIVENHHGFNKRNGRDQKASMPWGLYLNDYEDANDVLDWTLPVVFEKKVKRREPVEEDFQVNDYIYDILQEMVNFEPALEKDLYDKDGNELDDREYLALIIGNFPWPVGAQLRRLVSNDDDMNKPTVQRLEQIISTYIITSQLLLYILLSQLWDEKRKNTVEARAAFIDAMAITHDNFQYFDYFARIKQILRELRKMDIDFFIEEYDLILEEMEDKDGIFYNAYLFMESIRSRLISGDEANLEREIWQICSDSEYSLSIILQKVAFLVKYQMLTIRDIVISKTRHENAQFKHFMGRLNAQDNDFLSLFKKPRTYDVFVDSRSVILVKDLINVGDYLNLSPFIIDKNAFGDPKATSTDLFMYAYKEKNEYEYFVIRHSVFRSEEIEGDRINTGMEEKSESKVRKRSRIRGRGSRSKRGGAKPSPANKPYAMLKRQFEQFKTDLSV